MRRGKGDDDNRGGDGREDRDAAIAITGLSDRLRAAYPELFKNVRTVTHTVQLHQVKTPLVVELDWEELGDE